RKDAHDLVLRFPGRHAVEPRGVGEVLLRRHLLEERRLDRDTVDEPLDDALLLGDVVAEDRRAAAVVQEQCREQPDQRRLARAVLPEDRDAFAALDREGHAFEGREALPLASQAGARRVAAEELLAQVVDFNGVHLLLLPGLRRDTNDAHPRRTAGRRAQESESAEEQHRRQTYQSCQALSKNRGVETASRRAASPDRFAMVSVSLPSGGRATTSPGWSCRSASSGRRVGRPLSTTNRSSFAGSARSEERRVGKGGWCLRDGAKW